MRHSAPWNIKNESNNLLHGSVAKLANHFMIWARRLFSTNLKSVEKTNDNKKNRMKNVDNVGKKWSHICMCKFVSGTWCALFMLWGRNVIYINLWLKCRKCFNQTFINYKICMCRWIYVDGFWSLQRDNTKNSDVLQKSECVSSMTSFSKWFVAHFNLRSHYIIELKGIYDSVLLFLLLLLSLLLSLFLRD